MSLPQPGQEKRMSKTIESKVTSEPVTVPRTGPKPANAKSAKKANRAKKRHSKSEAARANKKAKLIALMKRAKGATLAEIMTTTDWKAHTVRGFVSILGSKGG